MNIIEQAQNAQQTAEKEPQTKSRYQFLIEQFKKMQEDEKTEKYLIFSQYLLILQERDIEEYRLGLDKQYHLTNYMRKEMIIRSAQKGCTMQSLVLTTAAARAIIGLGFLIESKYIAFNLTPIDRERYLLKFKLKSEHMSNRDIYYYNNEFDLNIPLNEKNSEIKPDEYEWQQDINIPAWLNSNNEVIAIK